MFGKSTLSDASSVTDSEPERDEDEAVLYPHIEYETVPVSVSFVFCTSIFLAQMADIPIHTDNSAESFDAFLQRSSMDTIMVVKKHTVTKDLVLCYDVEAGNPAGVINSILFLGVRCSLRLGLTVKIVCRCVPGGPGRQSPWVLHLQFPFRPSLNHYFALLLQPFGCPWIKARICAPKITLQLTVPIAYEGEYGNYEQRLQLLEAVVILNDLHEDENEAADCEFWTEAPWDEGGAGGAKVVKEALWDEKEAGDVKSVKGGLWNETDGLLNLNCR
ncbi:hypothetical protein BJ508DRAFT_311480 [Ascobolus immersus RN42]|uniref:Uncharacterized protein n=1 Tax=Ascobolus immersus RN42 TaxID=1160509 RepID=A0A3N4HQ58_ASCIM|nr:hypothetical protein BJ508DRAFT_311480 [Ascobolus immersus RN42]